MPIKTNKKTTKKTTDKETLHGYPRKKMTPSDKDFVEKTMNQIVDNMGKDYDKSLTKQMRKSKNNRQYIGNEEVGKFDEAKVNDRIETDAMNSVAQKYGIKMKSGGKVLKPVPAEKKGLSKLPTKVRNKMGFMKKGGRVGLKSGGLAKRGKGCEIK